MSAEVLEHYVGKYYCNIFPKKEKSGQKLFKTIMKYIISIVMSFLRKKGHLIANLKHKIFNNLINNNNSNNRVKWKKSNKCNNNKI